MNYSYIRKKDLSNYKDKNIYIYGKGAFSSYLEKAVRKEGGKIVAYIVDDAYLDSNLGDSCDKVISVSHYKEIKTELDVVINAVTNISRIKDIIEDNVFGHIYLIFKMDIMWKYDDAYFIEHETELELSKSLFADELSTETLSSIIEARKTGNADGVMKNVTVEKQYFNSITKEKRDGAFVDCGAYDGDSIEKYCEFYGELLNEERVFAFEPDIMNYTKLKKKYEDNSNVICINKGTWKEEARLSFVNDGNQASKVVYDDDSEDTVEVVDIDTIVNDEKVGMIKMDVEGCELETLQGASNCIKRDHPILLVSAYHKMEDFIELPRFIKTLETDDWKYNIYLRHHAFCETEQIIYAIPFCCK